MTSLPPLGYIKFAGSQLQQSSLKMFSLDDSLQGHLKEGDSLLLKGVGDDELVLCTGDETYSVSMVETSNAVLLLRPALEEEVVEFNASIGSSGGEEGGGGGSGSTTLSLVVEGVLGGQHEMKRIVAGVHRVREILLEEEWRDAAGRLGGGKRGGGTGEGFLALPSTTQVEAPSKGAGAGGKREDDEGEEDEEGMAVLRMMEEEEEAEREGGKPSGGSGGTAAAATVVVAASSSSAAAAAAASGGDESMVPMSYKDENTQGFVLEAPEFIAEAQARIVAQPLQAMRPGKYDSIKGGLLQPRSGRGWQVEELCCVVQGSEGEVRRELGRLGAVEVDGGSGRYILLGDGYKGSVIVDVCRVVKGEGWDTGAVPLGPLAAALDEHRPAIVQQVALSISTTPPLTLPSPTPLPSTCCLCPTRLALAVADRVLAQLRERAEAKGGAGVPSHASVASFLEIWRGQVEKLWPGEGDLPPTIKDGLGLALCKHMVLVNSSSGGPASGGGGGSGSSGSGSGSGSSGSGGGGFDTLRYFPERELPSDPAARFKALFAARGSWKEGDLIPFIEPLAEPPHRKLMDLVATFCRVTNNPDKTRTFSQR